MMELNPKTQKKVTDKKEADVGKETEQVLLLGQSGTSADSSASDNEVFVSVKSINISGSDSDLPKQVTDERLLLDESRGGKDKEKDNNDEFSIPDIKSETRVVVPRVLSDSRIGEGEGFHSCRLSSYASHASSLSSALLAIGITSESKNALVVDNVNESDKTEKCQSENECVDVKTELGESLQSFGNTRDKGKCKGTTLLGGCGEKEKIEPRESDIDLDTDLSIQVEHDFSVGNTEDFLDEELLEAYDEPDDELHGELEKIFESEFQPGASGGSSISKSKALLYVDSATWTQEDDMPSPLSDLSPVQSPKKRSGHYSNKGTSGTSGAGIATSSGYQGGGQFDHQCQYQGHQYYRETPSNKRHHHNPSGSSRSSRSQHRSSRGIHQSQSHQRAVGAGNSSAEIGEFIHHQPQQHHQPSECFTVSSQLRERELRLYENVSATPGELESLEILLSGENCNYPTSGGSAGASNTSKASTSNASQTNKTGSISSNKNNNGSSGSGGSSSTNNNHLILHHHHHSATNLNLGQGSTGNSVEQLFSVSELLGPGSCLVGGGPPSRTSWVDSGRESLSFDGENNNSGGSSRNLLLIPPPPPPPVNYQGFSNSSIIMQQSPSHFHAHSSRKTGSRRDRLVRQKHAIDETFLPIPTNSSDKLGIDQGGCGGYLAVPSPRRGILSSNIIASNFTTAAASPINLQRHPPASQIMLQENKKTKPLMPCESPYGMMSGGCGTGDWTFGGGSTDKKGHMPRDLLRCRSPQRGRTKGKNHQSFDYGELPSHQMFPKRHLLTSRQLGGSHNNHQGYPTGGGNAGNVVNQYGNNPGSYIQPQHQHRSFPVALFSGMTPKSCSMGDLTSSTASPNNPGHHNYQSFHGNGKASDQIALCPSSNPSSNVPLVGSLPLPPATSVTYEFSLAPQSGTLAPGWHLTAVQRGLATAVPLAAAVAKVGSRRRLPRTTRQRFGFTDKNEARRAKWTIAITALALLAMSMLLVGITLRLAPLIDDLVRKENENLMRVIQQTSPALNMTSNQTFTSSVPPPLNQMEDQDESSGSYNNNNNLIEGQSLTRSEIAVDPGPGQPLPINSHDAHDGERMKKNESDISSNSTSTTTSYFNEDKDRDESGSKPLSSSLIAEILLKSKTKVNDNFPVDKMMQDDGGGGLGNSVTSFKAESPSIFTEQIISGSDIDESDRVGTSIVLQ